MRIVHLLVAMSLGLPAAAQQPALTAEAPHTPVTMRVVAPGTLVPRIPEPKPEDGAAARSAISIEGRKLEWRVGDAVCKEEAEVQRLLEAGAAEWSRRAAAAGQVDREIPPLLVTPAPDVRWIEVLRLYDLAMATGSHVQLADLGPTYHWFLPKGVGEPVRHGGGHVVPKVLFNEPDDRPPAWRPVVVVRQDGSVEYEGKVVFMPARDRDLEKLRALFRDLAAASREHAKLVEFGKERLELTEAEILIDADSWSRYEDVRRVLVIAATSKPAFWRFTFAVGEMDFEAWLRRGMRPEK